MSGDTDGGTTGSDLGWSLALLLRRWHEELEAVLAEMPHGARGFHVLSAVIGHDLPTQAALAGHVAIDRTVLTYLLDDLQTAGLVERVPAPQDRRVRRIVATDLGRSTVGRLEQEVTAAESRVLGGLTSTAQQRFRTSAQRAAQAIRAESPGTDPCLAVESVPAAQPRRPGAMTTR